jgi:sulfonate transport system permease protein
VPLFIVWFGIGEGPKLLLIALATAFPIYLNTYSGVRNVDRKTIEAMQTLGLTGPRLIYEAVIPLALPSIFTGLRYSLGVAVLVLIAAEQINASAGLGYLLNNAQIYQQVDVIMICIVIYALLGLLGDLLVRLLERLLVPWRATMAAR